MPGASCNFCHPLGKRWRREEGMTHFQTFQLLDPETNIRLGTRYLRQTLDKFGGVPEYALAAYNAGESRVEDWQAAGPYTGIDEFVESIPFTDSRLRAGNFAQHRNLSRRSTQTPPRRQLHLRRRVADRKSTTGNPICKSSLLRFSLHSKPATRKHYEATGE